MWIPYWPIAAIVMVMSIIRPHDRTAWYVGIFALVAIQVFGPAIGFNIISPSFLALQIGDDNSTLVARNNQTGQYLALQKPNESFATIQTPTFKTGKYKCQKINGHIWYETCQPIK